MGFLLERQTIESFFSSAWNAAVSGILTEMTQSGTLTIPGLQGVLTSSIPVAYENVPFEPTSGQAWVRLTILTGSGRNASLGSTLNRWSGVIDVSIFVPQGGALGDALRLADVVGGIFKNASLSEGIRCRVPSIRSLGTKNGWSQINVSIPYQRDEIT